MLGRKEMRIVGYHISSTGIIANSDGEWTNKPPYLDWLLMPKPETLKVLYYMTQNIAALAKITKMSKEEVQKLNSKNNKAYLPPYKIDYIPNKYFALHKGYYWGAPFAFFGDAHQYKNTEAAEDSGIIECISKAKVAQEIGEEVFRTLQSIGLKPKSLTSPIKTFEIDVLSKLSLPSIDDIPEEAGLFAYECCKGNWVEAFQLGHWEKVWNYDICSAYPAQIAKLLDLRLGKWVQSNRFMPEAKYGYCKGMISINKDVEFTPFIYRQENQKGLPVLHCVTGKYPKFITKASIEFLERWKLGSFEIENGWWWLAEKEERPLKSLVNWLFLEKEKTDGSRRNVIKRIMAAMFGKMLEIRNEQFGNLFNPVWAAETEVSTRLEVADFVLRNKISVIHIAVDNVITPEPVVLGESGLGEWKLNTISPCLCAGTGAVAIRDEGIGDFHLKYDWLREQIEKEPEASEYKLTRMTPVTIREAYGSAEKFGKLGELQELTKVVSIGQGEKRCYREQPKNGKELLSRTYESLPWDVSLVSKPD